MHFHIIGIRILGTKKSSDFRMMNFEATHMLRNFQYASNILFAKVAFPIVLWLE